MRAATITIREALMGNAATAHHQVHEALMGNALEFLKDVEYKQLYIIIRDFIIIMNYS